MSARDKILRIKDRLCWSPDDKVTPEQLGDLANAMDANFDALLDDLDPLPEPDNFDLEPSDFGDIAEDGDDGAIGGNDGGDDGQDGRDGGPGGGPAGCIVPAQTPTGISGMDADQPGTGIAVLTDFTSQPADAEKAALNTAINGVENDNWGDVVNAHADWENARKADLDDPAEFRAEINAVVAYNISSQEVTAGKNILLGKDDEGKYWVLVESCDES